MPFLETGKLRVHHALTGASNAPALIFSNSLGTNFSMWDPQARELEKEFRVLRYDTRGHGRTAAPRGPYTIQQLAEDVLRLLDALRLERVHFCGLSMGGMIGMWLGVNAEKRLHKLVLCNTAARIGTAEIWNSRIENVRKGGMKAIAPAALERWFTPEFRARSPEAIAAVERMLEATPPEGYIACCEAIREMDQRESLSTIRVPTLVIAGGKDPATPPSEGKFIAGKIAEARYAELDAAHLSNLEAPAKFTAELASFLKP